MVLKTPAAAYMPTAYFTRCTSYKENYSGQKVYLHGMFKLLRSATNYLLRASLSKYEVIITKTLDETTSDQS